MPLKNSAQSEFNKISSKRNAEARNDPKSKSIRDNCLSIELESNDTKIRTKE